MTITKKTQKQYDPKNLAKGLKELERVKVEMAQVSESSLLVTKTTFPSRTPTRLMKGKTNVNLEYKIKVPRGSSLMIKHDIGEVGVSNVDGDIEATNRIGEIHLRMPGEYEYAVDARVKIGDVSSEFGNTDYSRQKLLGAKMESNLPPTTRRLYLRVGIGDIQVSKMPNEKAGKQNEKTP
jgi:predicted membrane protein